LIINGWILDLYPCPAGMTLWLIPQDGNRPRLRLIDRTFRACFYVHGPEVRLRRLARTLAARAHVTCAFTEKTNVWDGQALVVLQVNVLHPTQFAALARLVHRCDPGLRLYNSDLMPASLYCWEKGVFPLARVEVETSHRDVSPSINGSEQTETAHQAVSTIHAIECRDDPWALDYELPPLRTMQVRLEGIAQVNPRHGRHGALEVEIDGQWRTLDDADEPGVVGFQRLLRRYDPDLLVSEWGDSTVLPALLQQAQNLGFALALNRDRVPLGRRRAHSYFSYGRILFKESAVVLHGRLHVDTQNSFIADHCELEGLWELVRVTKLPVQYCARTSTGTGISYMQMELAYRDGVLIPEQKAEPESPKHPDELLLADRGGLIFPPRLGFFENVGELDFTSEYPNIMARFNISPETINCRCCPQAPQVPELGYRVCQRRRGITSRVVERLIQRRAEYKRRMAVAPAYAPSPGVYDRHNTGEEGHSFSPAENAPHPPSGHPLPLKGERDGGEGDGSLLAGLKPRPSDNGSTEVSQIAGHRPNYKLRRTALKWLLVTCFGYTGYKNARFGKIEAHESINALARETLLLAKEIAEQRGFRVLYAVVDSLYVQREGATAETYEALAREIEQRTKLPLALEDVYRYVVFLPSKQHAEIAVPNRFFAVAETGEVKIRGLECRRHDTPPLVARMQREALAILAEARDFESYCRKLEEAREILESYLDRVEAGQVSVEEIAVSRRLTRAPHDYRQASATAIAAQQLDRAGVALRPGEVIEYIITDADANYADDRVRALTLWESWRGYDVRQYQQALREAFKPFTQYVPCATTTQHSLSCSAPPFR
jgi:DNA polymerase elongation subunit (family B)